MTIEQYKRLRRAILREAVAYLTRRTSDPAVMLGRLLVVKDRLNEKSKPLILAEQLNVSLPRICQLTGDVDGFISDTKALMTLEADGIANQGDRNE